MRHVLSAIVQNVPGVLAHVSGMLASRGYNIDSLTVGETESFTTRGMIRFLTEQNRVRLEVNVGVAKGAGLTISSNVLRAARIVGATRG